MYYILKDKLQVSLRIWKLKNIKQLDCQLCDMVVKHGLLHFQ